MRLSGIHLIRLESGLLCPRAPAINGVALKWNPREKNVRSIPDEPLRAAFCSQSLEFDSLVLSREAFV